ncbi:MAG: hypothetical protein ACFB0B_21270 [Thermonemataceae bacterium]
MESGKKSRTKLDLYEDKQTEKVAREASQKLSLRADLLESDLYALTDLLDDYRSQQLATPEEATQKVVVAGSQQEKCLQFLKAPKLLERINQLIGESGIVGEENNRLFLFGIASSYKMPQTLHALIQGSSGSGKTHLLASILALMPAEDVISLTRVTESSFYNYQKNELTHKLIGLEDYDGLEEGAQLAWRELQSKGTISSSTSAKAEAHSDPQAKIRIVEGPIASLSATTQGEVYEDNMSRCFLVAVDESQEQTLRIIEHQNKVAAGLIDTQAQKEIKTFLAHCVRMLRPYQVINPYAHLIKLPPEAHKIRRLNALFQSYVQQITLLHQYQRTKDEQGRLITQKEDVAAAIQIMFESIVLKVDELDGSLRHFYEKLKAYVKEIGKGYAFSRLEVRQALKVSKSQQHHYFQQLLDLEYIQQVGGYANRGYLYKIYHWDDNEKVKAQISQYLHEQLKTL